MGSQLSLGFNTTFIGMGIVFLVLIILWFVVAIETKVIKAFSKLSKNNHDSTPKNNTKIIQNIKIQPKNGKTNGEAMIEGDVEDEIIPVIMATVSEYADIPINKINIKSIKAVK